MPQNLLRFIRSEAELKIQKVYCSCKEWEFKSPLAHYEVRQRAKRLRALRGDLNAGVIPSKLVRLRGGAQTKASDGEL